MFSYFRPSNISRCQQSFVRRFSTSKNNANIFVIYYSAYGHVRTLAEEIAIGVKETGCNVKVYQVQETLPKSLQEKIGVIPQEKYPNHPIITYEDLPKADGYLFGMPTRFGMMPSQMKSLFDGTGGMWANGTLVGKTASTFFSTGTQGGGQETTSLTAYTQLVHHGLIIVPMGYTHKNMTNMDEIHGGSAYGPGTYAGSDGKRSVSELEKQIARAHGKRFAEITSALKRGREQK